MAQQAEKDEAERREEWKELVEKLSQRGRATREVFSQHLVRSQTAYRQDMKQLLEGLARRHKSLIETSQSNGFRGTSFS